MYLIYFIAVIALTMTAIFLFSRDSLIKNINNIEFEEKTIYIVLRGTDSKSGWIAKKYNHIDNNASHVAIGLKYDQQFKVIHISDELSERNDNLFHENIYDFISRDDLIYVSIWKLKKIDINTFHKIKESIEKSTFTIQEFDKKIMINNDFYYCSEYVNDILEYNNIKIFYKKKIKINGIVKSYLGRDTLEYYPVDGFMESERVENIFTWNK